jgi:Asp-tRNA(Asn)/Glu-tRNA(Gln) amidotransferase A subunit family amidase
VDLYATPAVDLARMIRSRELSATELLAAVLARIEAVNPPVNAIVTLAPEPARAVAADLDARAARGSFAGPLHGLPIAIKDLAETAGIRTTFGSPIFASYVPDFDAPHVALLKQAGAVVIGKTNAPEFGAGSQTFNPVFGPTRNPYDTRLTPGGSSGGAAAAVATGMIPFADGSDLAASVRNPAAFCGVVGLRATAQAGRDAIFGRVRSFLRDGRYEVLALPTVQVVPFDVQTEWVREINGVPMATYIDWMRSCSRITVSAHPAVSVPAGLTPAGLPVGLQLVAPYGADRRLLEIAAAVTPLLVPSVSPITTPVTPASPAPPPSASPAAPNR